MSAFLDPLELLLRGAWPDPEGGALVGVPVRTVVIEASLAGSEADLVAPLSLGRRLAVVSDATTRAVLGERIERALAGCGKALPIVLEGQPHADAPTVHKLRSACASADALVAVGSGTINDLCKYAAAQDAKPYVVFATAPSMNGYASTNAAITVDGHKKTLPAVAPQGVFMDLSVLAIAPARLIRAGLGDALCRPTAQADWLLSHHLLGTPYRIAPFALLAADETALLESPEALLAGNLDAMRALARTLVLSGFGMTLCHGSYPASQGEHLVSHYIDMFAPAGREPHFHGEQVGVATLTMARIQEDVLSGGPPRWRPASVTCADLQRRFGAEIGASCWKEFEAKQTACTWALAHGELAAATWDEIRANICRVHVPAATLASVLERAGCPTIPADIGVARGFYADAVRNARFLRDRYTFLDLADDTGRLAQLWPA